jgi:6-phosphofructokinase 1
LSRQSAQKILTNETILLQEYTKGKCSINTEVKRVERPATSAEPNPASENVIGRYRSNNYDRFITADYSLFPSNDGSTKSIPRFLEAGPRKTLAFDPTAVNVAILTAGGIAPGLNRVIHAIVHRHIQVYKLNTLIDGRIVGIHDGYKGLISGETASLEPLDIDVTRDWQWLGGTHLGSVREYKDHDPKTVAGEASRRLKNEHIDILYVLGGDGSMTVAHEMRSMVPNMAIACVPKTMDNDVLWTWESFGYATAAEEAAKTINTLHQEAQSTRRICLVELFGAESGFVAANATLTSGQVDLVLIPEVIKSLKEGSEEEEVESPREGRSQIAPVAVINYLQECINHIQRRAHKKGHAIIVIAQGVSTLLENIIMPGYSLEPEKKAPSILEQLKYHLHEKCTNKAGDNIEVFINQPGHNIRAVPANARDQVYCERLGALAVDSALAGYTDFMVSQWMNEFVLVPLEMATVGQKAIHLSGVFWKQVMNSTDQPAHEKFLSNCLR